MATATTCDKCGLEIDTRQGFSSFWLNLPMPTEPTEKAPAEPAEEVVEAVDDQGYPAGQVLVETIPILEEEQSDPIKEYMDWAEDDGGVRIDLHTEPCVRQLLVWLKG